MSKDKGDHPNLTEIYSYVLKNLSLTPEHRRQLNRRGFDDEEIKRVGFCTLPLSRKEIVTKTSTKFKDKLDGVPGFWREPGKDWQLAGKPGILFPIRDRAGEIIALKVRVDEPSTPSQKYLLLSSNPKANRTRGEQKYPNGTTAKAAIHFPLGMPKKLKALRVTEGEIKAELATMLTSEYTVSIPGVALWKLVVDAVKELKPERVLLSFDADKDKARNLEGITDKAYGDEDHAAGPDFTTGLPKDAEDFFIGKCLASLYLALKRDGVNVEIEDWPDEAGKGIDDVLMNGATDQLQTWEDDEAEEFCKKMLSDGVPGDWVYVIGVKRFFHSQTNIELDKEQFSDRYKHEQKGDPASNALSNSIFPKADLPIYSPKMPMLFTDNKTRRLYNLWRPNELEPCQGDVKFFLEHLEYLIPDERERNILMDWMAYNIQFPGQKIHWAILLQGLQGTGKSYVGWVMRVMLGAHNVSNPTNEIIHENYTAWQKACSLVIVEEIMARGRLELMNKLKPIITQDITQVREMHKPAYEQPNRFNLLMFTNHEDAIILDKTDRRYCVIFSPAVAKDPEYYKRLWHETEKSAGAVLKWFIERDLSAFEPKAHAPMTTGKEKLIQASATPLQQWMADCIEGDVWPFQGDLVTAHHLVDCVPNSYKNQANLQVIGRTLKAVGAVQLGQIKLNNGSSLRVWAVRRQTTWQNEGPEAWAHEYQKWANASQPGGQDKFNPLTDAKPV